MGKPLHITWLRPSRAGCWGVALAGCPHTAPCARSLPGQAARGMGSPLLSLLHCSALLHAALLSHPSPTGTKGATRRWPKSPCQRAEGGTGHRWLVLLELVSPFTFFLRFLERGGSRSVKICPPLCFPQIPGKDDTEAGERSFFSCGRNSNHMRAGSPQEQEEGPGCGRAGS